MSKPCQVRPSVAVVVTVLNDVRLARCVASVEPQLATGDSIVIADGGSSDAFTEIGRGLATRPGVSFHHVPGSVAESRSQILGSISEDIVVFLDADETAPLGWLDRITRPIRSGLADVVGGPTRPLAPPASRPEAYLNRRDGAFYAHRVARDLAFLPMGNSAWSVALLRRIGGFDVRFTGGGEDYDVNLRAKAAGARYAFDASAWVYHDQSELDGWGKLWRKQRRYARFGALAAKKNGALGITSRKAAMDWPRSFGDCFLATAKLVGYLDARRDWNQWGSPEHG